ncbi:heterokaryon incompatibility protein-domain-containing protein, partial [Leptodontidium sp. 2 PMI_412]
LSYCWGGDQETRLTKERALEYRSGILSTSLPQTIQDAIHVTRSLKLQYLWVDSLCILQDDPQEKAAEIDKMVDYFKEAEVTICAASAKAASEGFLGIMAEIRYAAGPFELQYRCLGGELGSIQLFQEAELEPEPIAARAWTLQETSISRKTLIYSSNQLQWSCLETQVRDGGPSKGGLMDTRAWPGRTEIPSIQGTHPLPESNRYGCEILHDWHLTVENYMSRRMTQPEDKLPAISGLAQRYKAGFIRAKASFAERREPVYAAGLWTCAMDSSLLWVTVSPAVTRPQKYRAPSWSWAAVDGPI